MMSEQDALTELHPGQDVRLIVARPYFDLPANSRGKVCFRHPDNGQYNVQFDHIAIWVMPEWIEACGPRKQKTLPDKPGWWRFRSSQEHSFWAIVVVPDDGQGSGMAIPEYTDSPSDFDEFPFVGGRWLGPVNPTPLPMPFEDE